MHHNASSFINGAGQAFATGVLQHRARRQAYVDAVIEGRERDAMIRRVRALEAQLAASQRRDEAAEVDRRMKAMLRGLKG